MSSVDRAVRRVWNLLQEYGLSDKQLLLAVSGGADSMALAYLVSCAVGPQRCHAITVDHGFRPESAGEANAVSKYMDRLRIRHHARKLSWDQLPAVQQLEEVARSRRYLEISKVCAEFGIEAVLTGHHAGDQAETFLFRFLRQSGVCGLAGMPTQAEFPHAVAGASSAPVLVRPLLQFKKPELYEICKTQRVPWFEDASNKDTRFRRNQLRQVIGSKDSIRSSPFNTDTLLEVCRAMQRHRTYINGKMKLLLDQHAKFDTVNGVVELAASAHGPPEWARNAALRERILAHVVSWVNCREHPPELCHLRQFEQAITSFAGQTSSVAATAAHVSLLWPTGKRGWMFCRQAPRPGEIRSMRGLAFGSPAVWDRRLVISVTSKDPRGTWAVQPLGDAMQRWSGIIGEHRRQIKAAKRRLEIHAIQVTQPVVSVKIGECEVPVFALGCTVEGSGVGEGCRIQVQAKSPPMRFEGERFPTSAATTHGV
ncbi:hypothetical protein EC988_000074 [Linderina pennispora]|nr:hypothetical protein EC988_000074 [Linderina pennispora]